MHPYNFQSPKDTFENPMGIFSNALDNWQWWSV